MKYALIDLGSNSIRLAVYDVSKADFKILFKKKYMAGLAGFVENGKLSREGILSAVQAVMAYQHTLQKLGIDNLAVFATASLRNISNTEEAVEQIRSYTGIAVDVLSGKTEAECGYYGAMADIHATDGLFVDIGGASAELALFRDGQLETAGSVPVGSLKLYRDCVKNILPGKGSRERIEKTIRKVFSENDLADIPAQMQLVGVGGTIRAALRLCSYLYSLPEECRSFTKEQLDGLVAQLCRNDKNAVNLILRHEPERIHTLVPGLLLLRYLMEHYGAQTVTVSCYGVREGYLIRKIQPTLPEAQV
ncbi:MAG: hypothetical protein Q4C53_06490 [Clostridia bacterium]|nr:hypothetical protein [Clostridia bacterium]